MCTGRCGGDGRTAGPHHRAARAPLGSIPVLASVPVGSHVRFVVRNDDPIVHELIIGDAGVQLRHEQGTEAWHPPRPGEVSVAPGAIATTTFTFLTTGTTEFACHMPGHYAYGMRGAVTVTRSSGSR